MSQAEKSTRPPLPGWAIPILIFVGFAIILFFSNQRTVGPNGQPVVLSSTEYHQVSNEAMGLTKDVLEKHDRGDEITEADKKNLELALVKYESLAAFNPSKFEPYFGIAKVCLVLERYPTAHIGIEQAILNCQEALRRAQEKKDPEKIKVTQLSLAEAHFVNSRVLFYLGRYEESYAAAVVAADAVRNAPAYWWAAASAALELKKEDIARIAIKNALALDPTYRPALQLKQLIGP